MTESGGPQSRLKRAKKEAQDVAGIVGKTRSGVGKYAALVAVAAIIGATIQGASVQKIGFGPLQIDFSSNNPSPVPTTGPPTTPAPTTAPTEPPTTTPAPEPTTATFTPTPTTSLKPDAQGRVKAVWPSNVPEARAIVLLASAKFVGNKVLVTLAVTNNSDQDARFSAGWGGMLEATDSGRNRMAPEFLDSDWDWAPSGHGSADYAVLKAHAKPYVGTLVFDPPKEGSTVSLSFGTAVGFDTISVPDIPIAK